MAQLTDAMKELIETNQCFIATADPNGAPNLGPKGSTRVLDDEHLMFTEITGQQTWANVQAGSQVAIAVVAADRRSGYRFVGSPEVITSGPLLERAAEAMQARGIKAPVKGVVVMKVDAIYSLAGANPGQRIA